jgi:hypothetical protein
VNRAVQLDLFAVEIQPFNNKVTFDEVERQRLFPEGDGSKSCCSRKESFEPQYIDLERNMGIGQADTAKRKLTFESAILEPGNFLVAASSVALPLRAEVVDLLGRHWAFQ